MSDDEYGGGGGGDYDDVGARYATFLHIETAKVRPLPIALAKTRLLCVHQSLILYELHCFLNISLPFVEI
jgi:hypothetical protein